MHKKVKQIIKDNEVIGRRYYESLKAKLSRIDQNNTDDLVMFRKYNKLLVAEAEAKIQAYEEKSNAVINLKKINEYFVSLGNEKQHEQAELTKEWLWKRFNEEFYKNEKKVFKQTEKTLKNIEPLFHYFLEDIESLKKCENISKLSKVSLSKGIMIVGDYGCGKTAVMKAFESVFKHTNLIFKGYTTNDAVTMYEACDTPKEKEEVIKMLTTGKRSFDDVKTERQASNYGKTELFKEVFEIRNRRKLRTFITINYREGNAYDLNDALQEYGEKYGSRNYDRIFEDFIIIEFEGESFRG